MEKGTRWRVLEEVGRRGQASVADLAAFTGVSGATIHHHLARLEREGLIRTEHRRQGQGRPRLVCLLTEQGQALLPQGYRWLAEELLQAIATLEGAEQVDLVFQQVGKHLAARYRPRVEGKDSAGRLQEVVSILTELGFEGSATRTRAGLSLCNRHCPVLAAAQRYPQLCVMEQHMIAALLRERVHRIEHRLEGAQNCTYLLISRN